MFYAIMAVDRENSLELRKRVRSQHIARLQALQHRGQLFTAGPHPAMDMEDPGPAGFTGSLVIAEFASLEEARKWADEDPYTIAGVYASVEVKPFKKVFP